MVTETASLCDGGSAHESVGDISGAMSCWCQLSNRCGGGQAVAARPLRGAWSASGLQPLQARLACSVRKEAALPEEGSDSESYPVLYSSSTYIW